MQIISLLPNILQRGIWLPTRVISSFFLHFTFEGTEQLKELPKGIIFAVNHSSEFDPIAVPAAFPFFSRHLPMFYTSREKKFYKKSGWRQKFYGGWLFKIWGSYPVIAGLQNYEISLARHIEILEKGGSVCIFPEGSKTLDGNLKEGKGGVTYLSWRTEKPIVPVAISNVWKITPKEFFLRRRTVTIRFGKPLYPVELFAHCIGTPTIKEERNDFLKATQRVMKEIKELPLERLTVTHNSVTI